MVLFDCTLELAIAQNSPKNHKKKKPVVIIIYFEKTDHSMRSTVKKDLPV